MSQRTNPQAVQDVLTPGGDYDTVNSPSLQPYIDTASVIVDRVQMMAARKGIALSSSELEMIERWLSAHQYCCSDKTYASKSTSGASGSFQGQTTTGFEATLYGQTALRLDFSGSLQQLDKTGRTAG
jgi:hypothetical protein